jgi:hypothetical protein
MPYFVAYNDKIVGLHRFKVFGDLTFGANDIR